jgi:hypothetical protein
MIKRFVILFKLGTIKYPLALTALNKIREDRGVLKNMVSKFKDKDSNTNVELGLKKLYRDV